MISDLQEINMYETDDFSIKTGIITFQYDYPWKAKRGFQAEYGDFDSIKDFSKSEILMFIEFDLQKAFHTGKLVEWHDLDDYVVEMLWIRRNTENSIRIKVGIGS